MNEKRFSVQERVAQFAPKAEPLLRAAFAEAGAPYPPGELVLVGLKQERRLQVYAPGPQGKTVFIKEYPFTAFSGTLGPKLREGDGQIPEGLYRIESLNPNSRYHLSLRVGYPNEFDRRMGRADSRAPLGGDIMIHGKDVTIGCIPLGDPAIEELFVLAARVGPRNIRVVISPVDFRRRGLPKDMPPVPPWTGELYRRIADELRGLPLPRR